jgi:hypothetical protein
MSGAIPVFSLYACITWRGKTFTFTFTFGKSWFQNLSCFFQHLQKISRYLKLSHDRFLHIHSTHYSLITTPFDTTTLNVFQHS